MCIHAHTAASLFAWPQCHDCPLHLFKALGEGHARSSGCHILLNVALTPEFPFKCKEVVVFPFYLLANKQRSVQCHQESWQPSFWVGVHVQHAHTAASLFAWLQCHDCPLHLFKALGGGHARPSGCHILLNVALTPKYPFKRREVVVFFLHLLATPGKLPAKLLSGRPCAFMPTQQVCLHGCNAMIVRSIFLRHLAEGMLGLQGLTFYWMLLSL